MVARRAGVSRSTVSVVLNGRTSIAIAPDTRQRVLDAAADLGYVPSAAARHLASGSARTIGLVISYTENLKVDAFVPQALYSLNEAAHRRGFRLLVEALEDVTLPDAYHALVRGKQIDGLIVLNPRDDDPGLVRLIDEGYPLIVIGHAPEGLQVDVDNVAASRSATQHLIDLGRTHIAYLAYAPLAHHSSAMRVTGWREAMESAGLEADDAWVEIANFSADSGRKATTQLLERVAPDALVVGNDVVAFGAMTALRDAGLRIPQDVAVVGFDDVPLAEHASPPLTTVRLPAVEMGQLAAERLIRRIQGSDDASDDTAPLPTKLIVRASCGAVGTVD